MEGQAEGETDRKKKARKMMKGKNKGWMSWRSRQRRKTGTKKERKRMTDREVWKELKLNAGKSEAEQVNFQFVGAVFN